MLNSLDQRTRVLFAIVFCLIVVRFAVVPLINWQNEQLVASRELSSRLSKAEKLISSGRAEQNIATLGEQLNQLKARYFANLSALDVQVKLDERIDSSISKFNLRLQSRAWRFSEDQYLTAEARLSVEGAWPGLVRWIHDLENQQKFAEISELRINPSRGRNNNEVVANLTIRYRVLKKNV